MDNLSLLFLLLALTLPLVAYLAMAVVYDFKEKGLLGTVGDSMAKQLEEMMASLSTSTIDEIQEFVGDIIYIEEMDSKNGKVFTYDGKVIFDESKKWIQHLPNNFIHYQGNYLVNRHFVKKIRKQKLELFNGENIPDDG